MTLQWLRRYMIPFAIVGFITLITIFTKYPFVLLEGQPKNITGKKKVEVKQEEVCRVNYIDPFSKQIMQYVQDFGEQKCSSDQRVQVSIANGNISISVTDLDFLRMRRITDDAKAGFRIEEFAHTTSKYALTINRPGAIRNTGSQLCIAPAVYNSNAPPHEIEVIFSGDCENKDAIFIYTRNHLIVHKRTGKCLKPQGGAEMPAQNTPLVLSSDCQSKFNVINNGVLQLVGSSSCVHPLWGKTGIGVKLCLYPECEYQTRLAYESFHKHKQTKHVSRIRQYILDTDMCFVQAHLLSEEIIDIYALTCIPGPTPTITSLSTSPNIVVLCIEEASIAHFKRKLQHVSLAMSEMGFIEYKKHSAVSESALLNFVATVNGISDIKEAEGTETSIFNLAKTNNYMSMVTSDDPSTLDKMRKRLDVDHNSLPFFRYLKEVYKVEGREYCVNGQPMHDLTFRYLLSFLNAYPYHAKLAVIMLSELCRANFNNLGYLGYLSEQMKKLLDFVKQSRNTIILIHSLKGGVTAQLRQVKQGVEEIKRPLLATYVSKDMRNKYNFKKTRSSQLSTPFDIHVTLRHLITSQEQSHRYGRSLLKTSKPRNCQQAAVDPSMCPCV